MNGPTFRVGDVVRYSPQPRFPGQRDVRWCREGTAIAEKRDDGRLVLVDTFWGSGSDNHVLTDAELATAEIRFNLNDYDALKEYPRGASHDTWMKYAPAHRETVTAQHGLQSRYYIRKGAQPDLDTQIVNARAVVADAEAAVDSAKWHLECARRDLAALQQSAVTT